jgi:putative peptidoglycan lipid II flippase
VIVYVAANQLAYFVIITMNNRISTGAYTAYAGAFIVFSLPHAIVAVSIFTALLPSVSERWAEDDRVGVRELFSRGMRDTLILMIPAAVGFIALAGPIVSLLAEHGAVTESDTALVARTLMAFAVGLPFFSSFQLLTRTLYAGRDSRTPALVNVAVAAVNLGANLILAFRFDLGVPGLALGYAISYMAGTLLLLIALRRRLGQLDGRRIWGTVARAAAAALVTGLVAFASAAAVAAVADVTRTGVRAIQVGVAVTLGVLVFVASAAIFGVQEIGEIRGALRARARR